ncbi:MAG: hypothetical protein ACU0DI_01595 [Paracoccaceae bacterium]
MDPADVADAGQSRCISKVGSREPVTPMRRSTRFPGLTRLPTWNNEVKMSVAMEHDTLPKSRRSLLIVSAGTIVLHFAQLNSSELEIFELKIAVTLDSIIIAAQMSILYLSYVFWMQANKHLGVLRGKALRGIAEKQNVDPIIQKYTDHIIQLFAADDDTKKDDTKKIELGYGNRDNKLRGYLVNIAARYAKIETQTDYVRERNYFLRVDAAPVALFVVLALLSMPGKLTGFVTPYIDQGSPGIAASGDVEDEI